MRPQPNPRPWRSWFAGKSAGKSMATARDRSSATCRFPLLRFGALLAPPAAALLLSACAGTGASRQFDVDAFLRASDTALPEVIGNPDFLKATLVPAAQCATLLQSPHSGVLEDLPQAGGRGPAWILHPAGVQDKVWLVTSVAGGERSCHGPLPADAMKALAARAKD